MTSQTDWTFKFQAIENALSLAPLLKAYQQHAGPIYDVAYAIFGEHTHLFPSINSNIRTYLSFYSLTVYFLIVCIKLCNYTV